jgi:hypothetical protein
MPDADRSRATALTRSVGRRYGQDGRRPHLPDQEDDVTEPGIPTDVPDADRAEQESLVDPPDVVTAADAAPPPGDVPEADALEQQLSALPRVPGGAPRPVGNREANEADVLDQETDVPLDDDDLLS